MDYHEQKILKFTLTFHEIEIERYPWNETSWAI